MSRFRPSERAIVWTTPRSIPTTGSTPGDGDGQLLDTEADVPAQRILEQPATGDSTTLAGFGADRQGARPPESYSPDQQDRDLAPAAIHTDDS